MPITGFEIAAIKTAYDQATGHLSRARALRKNDAEACAAYLQAVMDSILGLENARNELLCEAKWLGSEDDLAKARSALQTRLESFFTGRTLLPKLIEARAGIEACTKALKDSNDSFFGRMAPSGKRRRELVEAIQKELSHVIRYIDQLRSELGDDRLTAPGIYGLMALQSILNYQTVEAISQHASNELKQRGNLDQELYRVACLINDVKFAFR